MLHLSAPSAAVHRCALPPSGAPPCSPGRELRPRPRRRSSPGEAKLVFLKRSGAYLGMTFVFWVAIHISSPKSHPQTPNSQLKQKNMPSSPARHPSPWNWRCSSECCRRSRSESGPGHTPRCAAHRRRRGSRSSRRSAPPEAAPKRPGRGDLGTKATRKSPFGS